MAIAVLPEARPEKSGSRDRAAPLPVAVRVLVGLLVLGVFALQMAHPLSGDVSWLITATERLLAGQKLYSDIFELNPPMCVLLYLPAVALGQAIGIAPEGLVVGEVLLAALGALWLGDRILYSAGIARDRTVWWFVGALVLMLLPGWNFAEREHFALVGVVPMLASLVVRAHGGAPNRGPAIAAGIGGGLAIAIKPHFALAILVPALYAAWRAKSPRPILSLENFVAAGVVVAFWAMVALLFPQFFTTMLPLAAAVYAGDRLGAALLFFGPQTWLLWGFVVVLAVLYHRRWRALPLVIPVLAALGFFLAYLVQGKGFSYHLMPATALVTWALLTEFAGTDAAAGRLAAALPKFAALLLVALPVLLTPYSTPERMAVTKLLRPFGPGLKIANITPQLDTTSPLEREIGATLVNSGPFLWMALGAIRIERTNPPPPRMAAMQIIERRERDMLRQDLLRNPPDFVLAGADGFDWLGWAKADPAIAGLLAGYTEMARIGTGSNVLTVLKRNGLQPPI